MGHTLIATILPMTLLSPIAKTTPVQDPWTTNVELSARLRVSSALSDVGSMAPGTRSLMVRQLNLERQDQCLPLSSEKRAIEFEVT
jgi:hypothetical protein